MRSVPVAALLAVVVALALPASMLAAGPPAAAPYAGAPFWFRDDYTSRGHVDPGATTAAVDTADGGTVRLPYAPAGLSFDPAGTYALVATQGGVFAYVDDGPGVVPVRTWRLRTLAATGAAWIDGGAAFAVSTSGEVAVYGLSASGSGYAASEVASAAISGALGVAPGPAGLPAAVLVATDHGATLVRAEGAALAAVGGGPSGLTGNEGVAAAEDGAAAATWQGGAVQVWLWDGTAYLPAPQWSPPPPAAGDGTVVGVAFFPRRAGYWVLTSSGRLLAFAYGPAGLRALPPASATLGVSTPPAAVAAGWSADALGVLYPDGWRYLDLQAGALRVDAARGLTGASWPLYAGSAVLQSEPLAAPHAVDEVRVEDADCPAGMEPPRCANGAVLPPGTSVAYQVSTDGCRTWTGAAAFSDVSVPAGSALCYRLLLRTADRALTPVVGVTDLYEIAARTTTGPVPALLCQGATC